jgi:predicted RNA-binding Zn-ribbon protein involved in translation (DUF1610 family)
VIHFKYTDNAGLFFDGYSFRLPYWLPITASLAFTIWSYRRLIQFNRLQSQGRCTHCNYDLRAHKPGDLCPECGTLILEKSAKMAKPEARSSQ